MFSLCVMKLSRCGVEAYFAEVPGKQFIRFPWAGGELDLFP